MGNGPSAVRITKTLSRPELENLVGIAEAPTQEVCDERDRRSGAEWGPRLPLDRPDVLVPRRRVLGIGRIARHHLPWSLNDDLGGDIYRHVSPR
jgi:hypothetical protein